MIDKIIADVKKELEYADNKWGTVFDSKNTINDWATYIGIYLAKATLMGATTEEQRANLVKVANIAVSALRAFDTNGGFAPRHYDGA